MCQLLQGDALAYFNQSAANCVDETNENFYLSGNNLILHVLPVRALQEQKRYMRQFLQKPVDVCIWDFMTCLIEINKYLQTFPPFLPDQKLPLDEILDIAEYAVPVTWQQTMHMHGFEPVMHMGAEFIEFCERIEFTEWALNRPFGNQNRKRQNPPMEQASSMYGTSVTRKPVNNQFYNWKRKLKHREQFCVLHQCQSHDTSESKVLLEQAKRMRNFDTHQKTYSKLFNKKLRAEPKKVTAKEHHQLSWLVESYLSSKMKKPEVDVNIMDFTVLHNEHEDETEKITSDSKW